MDQLKTDLYNLVSEELVEVAWHADYPLNQGVGLWSFIEAFKRGGFVVDTNHGERKAEFFITREVLGESYEFHTQMTFDQISRGWGRRPQGSPHCLYDSICAVHDLMEREKFPRDNHNRTNLDKRGDWSNFRNNNSRKIRELMEKEMKGYFHRYQEHLFIPVSGNVSKLEKPRLVYQIIDNFPLFAFDIEESINNSLFDTGEEVRGVDSGKVGHGPVAETILEYGFDYLDYDGTYYPSESTLVDLFLGRYLHRLSQIKGYNNWGGDQSLRDFTVSHHRAFKHGPQLEFPKEIKNEQGRYY